MDACRKNILGKGELSMQGPEGRACLGKFEGHQGSECLEGRKQGGRCLGDEGKEMTRQICGSLRAIAWILLVTLSELELREGSKRGRAVT